MATRKQVNDLYQQYLGRDAEPSGLDYWTSQNLSLSDIEYNIARSPEAQAKTASYLPSVSGLGGGVTIKGIPVGFGLFAGSGSPLTFPTDLLMDELGQGRLFQDFISIFRGYVEDQDADDPDRVNRANEASRWLNLLAKYAEGDATQEDLQNFDAEFLSEIPAWNEYFKGIAGVSDTGTGEDTDTRQKTDKLAGDLNATLGGIVDEQVLSDYLYNSFAPGGDMPQPTGSGPTIAVDVWECLLEQGGSWDECTTLGVVLQLPGLPAIPSAILGTIFKDVTLKEIKDIIVDTGTTVKEIITGECDSTEQIEDPVGSGNYRCPTVVDIVLGKISEKADELGDIFDQNCDTSTGENCGITPTDIIKTVGGGLGNAVLGAVLAGAEDAVRNAIGLPVNITGEDTTCTEGTVYDPDANNGFGGCVQIGTEIDYGLCDDNLTLKLDEEGTNCPPGQSMPQAGDDCFTANDEAGTITNVGGELKCVPKAVSDPACQDPNAQNYGEIGDCGECKAGYSRKPGQTDCTKDDGGGGDGVFDLPCPEGHKRFNGECDLPCPTNPSIAASDPRCGGGGDDGGGTTTETPTFTVVCGQKEPYAPTGNALAYNLAYREYEAEYNAQCLSGGGGDTGGNGGEEQCSGGKVRVNGVCVCPAGTTEINGECVSVGGGDDTTSTGGGTTFNCISQNRQTNEDGSCGACLPGYSPDPNNFDECVKDDVVVGGEPPGPTEPPAASSGGGGAVGGGAGGMFTGTVSGISYAPQALPGIQTPAPVNAMASLEGLIGRMLTGNIS